MQAIKEQLGIKQGETTADGLFTFIEVECLSACASAPIVQINDDYYENVTPETAKSLLTRLKESVLDASDNKTAPPPAALSG